MQCAAYLVPGDMDDLTLTSKSLAIDAEALVEPIDTPQGRGIIGVQLLDSDPPSQHDGIGNLTLLCDPLGDNAFVDGETETPEQNNKTECEENVRTALRCAPILALVEFHEQVELAFACLAQGGTPGASPSKTVQVARKADGLQPIADKAVAAWHYDVPSWQHFDDFHRPVLPVRERIAHPVARARPLQQEPVALARPVCRVQVPLALPG